MGKTLALIVGLPVIASAAAAGYITYQNIERYDAFTQTSLRQANDSLAAQGVAIQLEEVSRGLFGATREELYHVRLLGEEPADLFSIRQQVTIEPPRASGTFMIDPQQGLAGMMLQQMPELLAGQQGEWHLDGGDDRIYGRYQTGAIKMTLPDGGALAVAPLILQTETRLDESARGTARLSLASASLQGSTQGDANLQQLELSVVSSQRNGAPFIDKASYRIGALNIDSPAMKIKLNNLQTEQAALIDRDTLASLSTLTFSNLRVSSADKELNVDPSNLSLYIDGVSWSGYRRLLEKVQSAGDDQAAIAGLMLNANEVLKNGGSLALESFETAFIFNDLSPGGIGASGDLKVNGKVRLDAGDAAGLPQELMERLNGELQINLSRSLMQSPLAEHFISLLDAGMLQDQDGRLVSQLKLQHGQLSANDIAVAF